MTGLVIKLIVCPTVVYLSSLMFRNQIFYPSVYQIILVGLVLAVAAHLMEVMRLSKRTIWTDTALDFAAATIIVYLSGFVFRGAIVTFIGALLTAFLLAITEVIQHYYLTGTGKVVREDSE